ncbi:MAG: hypothetical protein WAV30_01430 [Microgenomates group bacterium]
MNVVPALLEQDVEVQKKQLLSLSRHYSRFQIDIADNIFVPNKTTQVDELLNSSFFNIAGGVLFDFHLMVADPIKHIDAIKLLPKKRVGTILIHYAVFPQYSDLKRLYPTLRFGLVLNPKDEVDAIPEELISRLPSLQIMTITPGFQGSSFIEKLLIKIEQARKRGYRGEILIDGSVNEKTIPIILSKEYKPDILGIGSFLTKASPKALRERVDYLTSLTG